ncbi:aminopeptidase P family protein [Pseudokordiimonas caeni]|uniref:aminopeptidase P family protein n=1 Tax=Pseudokordiimonas caeni TaxID=2997908 RepID=UPI002810A26F|nr:aminopeptidase P family protein [Pseudokordiimonas caeni]
MATNPAHLEALRGELKARGLDGFIIPLTDEHMSEYVGAYAQRLAWVTGFNGSAGNAVVLLDKAAIFVDGRYTVQVAEEVDDKYIERHHFEKFPLLKWAVEKAPKGAKIGYDQELATVAWEALAREAFAMKGIELVAVDGNPIDAVWTDQPAAPLAPAVGHDQGYTGESATEKRTRIASDLKAAHADAAVITMLDSVAWAFNIRGTDVSNTPVTHAFALLNADGTGDLFINEAKVTDALRTHLGNGVRLRPRDEFYPALAAMGSKAVLVDRATNNAKVFATLKAAGAKLIEEKDPCVLMKARKNRVEQQGARDAHVRDGVAVSEFLHWLSVEAPKGGLDELKAADKLWSFRQKQGMLKDKSFDTISAAGPHAALPHYRVSAESNRPIKVDEIYLVDSGGQYLDGTTDITRTIIVGTPSAEMKDRFTRVLRGHIALSQTRFPIGTPGRALDSIARRPLWEAGVDYDHGTGHGVGSYLSVHEGPQRIAKFGTDVPLAEGMILSNEPGYYKVGAYGIRIENLVMVQPVGDNTEWPMLGFENLTWAPIDKNLIDIAQMSAAEIAWLDGYHAEVRSRIAPLIAEEARTWLEAATAPLAA